MVQDKIFILVIIQRDLTHGDIGVILTTRHIPIGDPGGCPPPLLLRTVIVNVHALLLDKLRGWYWLYYWFGPHSFHECVE